MRLIRLLTVLAGLVACCRLVPAANAGTFTYNSYGFSGENVHISDSLLGVDNEYGGAGLITLDGSSALSAYCVDIADWLLTSGTYNSGVNPAANPNLAGLSSFTGHTKIADIAALIANGTNDAAIQVAIWDTEYGSAVTITPDDSGLQAVANTYLSDLRTIWAAPANFSLDELTPANGQTNQTLVYLARIPEPASMVALGLALSAVGYLRARRQRRAKGLDV